MVSLNEKRSKVRYAIQNKSEWVEGQSLLSLRMCLDRLSARLDTNKFGQKMLEKMGWTSGVGLGKNEDGNVEHIDLKFKSNLKGVGYVQGKYDSTWIEHSLSFDDVLQQLQQSHSTNTKSTIHNFADNVKQTKTRFTYENNSVVSLDDRSSFRYKKQSSGKDLSSRSVNELDCIFGKNSIESPKSTPVEVEQEEKEEVETNVYITSKQSISDYFLEKKRKRAEPKEETPDVVGNEDRQEEKKKTASVFVGSSLEDLEGYSGWKIDSSLDDISRRKEKQRKKKLRSK